MSPRFSKIGRPGGYMPRFLGRRRFLRMVLAAGAGAAGLGWYTWQIEPHWLQIVRRRLAIRHLPASLEGRTLAQLSDLHVGPQVADDYILETFRRVRALRPDIIAYTGDFVSYAPGILAHAKRIYADLPRGQSATVGILGNHDYGQNWSDTTTADRLATQLQDNGVKILRNNVTDIAGLQVAGLDDLWAHRFDLDRVLHALEPDRAALVLSHNPDTVDLPNWSRYQGWILAGHTHGGQCKAPFLPPPLLPVQNRRYVAGGYALSGGRRMYINRGVGHLLQVRFNVRPEVTLFELHAA